MVIGIIYSITLGITFYNTSTIMHRMEENDLESIEPIITSSYELSD